MMNRQVPSTQEQVELCLVLKDGSNWNIISGNGQASVIVSHLADVMQLSPVGRSSAALLTNELESGWLDPARQLLVLVSRKKSALKIQPCKNGSFVTCVLGPANVGNLLAIQMMRLSLVIVAYTEIDGAVLVHGALAEKNGYGVILAGPGRRGKTTASNRLVSPWRSLCDDTTLLVCDKSGAYWAHPWPTWSSFMYGGDGGTWNVQNAVPIKAIFFLNQAQKEQIESLGAGQATCLLTESSEQASRAISLFMERKELRKLRQLRFDSICALTKAVPSYVLRLSRNGAFWKEIERVLND